MDAARASAEDPWQLVAGGASVPRGQASELAYQRLRQLVITGALPIGERLAEERLAERMGVSRTPVRAALSRLHSDKLLDWSQNAGYFVAEPQLTGLRDLYELRITLETRGLARVLETGHGHDLSIIEPLRDRWKAMATSPPEADPSFLELDEGFHVDLSRASGNTAIPDALCGVNARIRSVRMYDFMSADRVELTISQHLGILEGVLSADLDTAMDRLRRHVGESLDVVEERATRALTKALLARSGWKGALPIDRVLDKG